MSRRTDRESFYKRGLALGQHDIRTDTAHFIFRGEKFEFPTTMVIPISQWNGHFYIAPIKKLRGLAKEK